MTLASLTVDQLRIYPLFKDLDENELTRLAPLLTRRVLAKGAYLFYPGDPGESIYLLKSGLVRLFFTNASGQEFLLNLVCPFEVIGLPMMDDDQVRVMGAAAHLPSVVLSISKRDLFALMDESPHLMRNVYREVSNNARKLLLHTRTLATVDLNGRLATLLLRLSRKGGNEACTVAMPLTQAELAGWLGASRGRLNRAMIRLQQMGLICMEEQKIMILDRPGLESLTEEPLSVNG